MSLEIGIQLFSVKKAMSNDYFGTLQRVSDIGYKNIELYFHSPYFARFEVPCAAKELKKRTRDMGLSIVSSHVMFNKLLDWDEVIAYHAELGCRGIVIPLYLYNLTSGNTKPQEAVEFSKWLNKTGEKCKKAGMGIYYHNYFNEFEKFDGKYIFDLLLENTDPELVKFEVDAYWTVRGGLDPVEWLKKVGNRCELLSVCDLKADAPNKNLVEVEGSFNNAFYPKIHTHYGDYCEIGEGVIDIAAVVEQAKSMDSVKYVFVNQSESGRKGEFECAEHNLTMLDGIIK